MRYGYKWYVYCQMFGIRSGILSVYWYTGVVYVVLCHPAWWYTGILVVCWYTVIFVVYVVYWVVVYWYTVILVVYLVYWIVVYTVHWMVVYWFTARGSQLDIQFWPLIESLYREAPFCHLQAALSGAHILCSYSARVP